MSRKLIELVIHDEDEMHGVEAISLVEYPAIESNWIFFSKQDAPPQSHTLLALASVDEDKRTLIGAALIPDKHIPRFDEDTQQEYDVFFSKDTVRKASELFLMQNRTNKHTFEHQTAVEGVSVVESWIVEDPQKDKSAIYNMSMPVGTWMVRVHVGNDDMWKQVKEQNVRGFSIEGYFADKAVQMQKPKKLVERLFDKLRKRNFYAETRLEDGVTIATEADELTSGVEVFRLDIEGYPADLANGFYRTEAGTEFEVYDGVILKWDGEPKIEEEEPAEEQPAEAVELDTMKVAYYKHLLKNKYQKVNNSVTLHKKVEMGANHNLNKIHDLLGKLQSEVDDYTYFMKSNYGNALDALDFSDLLGVAEEMTTSINDLAVLYRDLENYDIEFHDAL